MGSFCLELCSVILQLNRFQYRNIKLLNYSGARVTVPIGLILHPGKQAVSDIFFKLSFPVLLMVEISLTPAMFLRDRSCFKFSLFLTLQAFTPNSTPLMVYHKICSEASIF